MTATDAHDISSDFEWKQEYQKTLEWIAETDQVDPELDWPPLKDAIKYKLKQAIAAFPDSSAILHPAAILIPLIVQQQSQQSPQQQQRQGQGQKGQGVDNSATNGPSTIEDGNVSNNDNGTKDPSGSDSSFLSTASNNTTSPPPQYPSIETMADAHGVFPADQQGFYPSKRQPPPPFGGSWGRRLSAEELQRERDLIFGMLDEFDTQPPFTIQRLCELAVNPLANHKTVAKFLSALQRVLAVTATRDAFPISPTGMDAVLYPEVNGLVPDYGIPPLGEDVATCQIINGRSRSPSSSSSLSTFPSQSPVQRHSEPLFSPIPFLLESDSPPPSPTVTATESLSLIESSEPISEDLQPLSLSPSSTTNLLPIGQVDELDTPDHQPRPISSTTTLLSPLISSSNKNDNDNDDDEIIQDLENHLSPRVKRIRSDQKISSPPAS